MTPSFIFSVALGGAIRVGRGDTLSGAAVTQDIGQSLQRRVPLMINVTGSFPIGLFIALFCDGSASPAGAAPAPSGREVCGGYAPPFIDVLTSTGAPP